MKWESTLQTLKCKPRHVTNCIILADLPTLTCSIEFTIKQEQVYLSVFLYSVILEAVLAVLTGSKNHWLFVHLSVSAEKL